MVRIFINGQEVHKEDLSKYEIKSEDVKRILLGNLPKANKKQTG